LKALMCCGHSAMAVSAAPGLGFEVITRAYIVGSLVSIDLAARVTVGARTCKPVRLFATRRSFDHSDIVHGLFFE